MGRAHVIPVAVALLSASQTVASSASVAAQAAATEPRDRADEVLLRANPARVCFTARAPAYLNFDLLVRNNTAEELKVQELRAFVTNANGELVERRLIWQQALDQLSPDRTVSARSEALIFNPFLFGKAMPGSQVRYEVDLSAPSGMRTASATIEPRHCANAYSLVLPIRGRVLVYDGYDLYSHHRRTGYGGPDDAALGTTDNFQRFGLDLVVVDPQGRFYRGNGSTPDLWLGWGKPVLAAGSGIVAAVHDGQPDNQVIGDVDKWLDRDMKKNPMTSYGNYVLIQHGAREYSVVAHLKQGSVRVRKGQRVRQGQVIAAVGNSGASGGVHVHFERRTGPGVAGIETLPPYFRGLSVPVGEASVRDGVAIDTGDIVISN